MDNEYQWVPFYEALADKLLTYNNKRSDLFELIKKVTSEQPLMKYLHFEREDWWGPRNHRIDPFSVIGVMNRGTTDANRTELAKVLSETFDIQLPAPTQFAGIPVMDNRKSFFAGPDEIWELYVLAMEAAKTNTYSDEFKKAFEKAIAVNGNGLANITMGLYWMRPNVFMPLDGNSRAFVSAHYGITAPGGSCSGDEYVTFLNTLNIKVGEQTPGLTFPEISYTAWTQKDSKTGSEAKITTIVVDEQQQRAAFRQWYVSNVGSANSANTISTAIGKARLKSGRALFAIADFDELDAAIKSSGLDGYFQTSGGNYSLMDLAFDIDPTTQRDDLKSGIKYYLNFLKSGGISDLSSGLIVPTNATSGQTGGFRMDKNILIYGAPGTGKTYSTVLYAVSIIEEKPLDVIKSEANTPAGYDAVFSRYLKYKEDGLIAFITFHQSFGYEEFIEGIRPILSSDEKAESEHDIEYDVRDGIFKAFCDKAGTPVGSGTSVDLGFGKNPRVWKVSLFSNNDNNLKQYCFSHSCARLGKYDVDGQITDSTDFHVSGGQVVNTFHNKIRVGDIIISPKSSKEIDGIGVVTGDAVWVEDDERGDIDDYHRSLPVKWLATNICVDVVSQNAGKTMMPPAVTSLSITPNDIVDILKGVKPQLFVKDKNIPNRVFIIDEINRGNISKIFGELITLIEPSKRIGAREQLKAILPYSGQKFGVPDNVYIIGTMNTADRSIAMIDTALRRRFSFVEMQPDSDLMYDVIVDGIDIAEMLATMNRRITVLLDREHTVGHSYFLSLIDDRTLENLARIFENKIVPLLQEYFYDDYEKIQLVLGDNQKPDDSTRFIVKKSDAAKLFGNAEIDYPECYEINREAFMRIDAYAFL